MNIQLFWDDDDHTIIRSEYRPGWTWEEFHEASRQSLEMINEVRNEQTVHMIANFANGAFPPMGALANFKSAQQKLPKDTVIVVIGGGMFINTLVSTYTRVYRPYSNNLFMVNSLEEARAKIAQLHARFSPSMS